MHLYSFTIEGSTLGQFITADRVGFSSGSDPKFTEYRFFTGNQVIATIQGIAALYEDARKIR